MNAESVGGQLYLVQSIYCRREAPMYTENLVVNDCGQTQIIEYFSTVSPYIH